MNPRRAVTACIAAIRAARGVQHPGRAFGLATTPPADDPEFSLRLQPSDGPSSPNHFNIPVRPEYRNGHPHLYPRQRHRRLNPRRLAPSIFAVTLSALGLTALATTAHAQSYDWAPMALVSETMGVNANRLCMGEGTRGDIGCPTWAPTATTTGLEVSGTVSATRFLGDGSGLTGIAANVSVTSGASGSLVFRDGYGSLMASSGLSISSTTGSIGIGAGAPSWTGNNGLYAVGGIATSSSLYLNSNQNVYWGSGVTKIYGLAGSTNDIMAFSVGGSESLRIVSTGYVGIGTAYPSNTLHVAGTGQFASVGINTSSTAYGRLSLQQPADNALSGIGLINTGSASGRIWMDASANNNLVLSRGVSPVLVLHFSNSGNDSRIAINTSSTFQPLANLHASGTALITSWTAVNLARAATAPLEVSGTISATALTLNGVAVNAGTSTFASLTDVSFSYVGSNIFGPGSLAGANADVTNSTAFGRNALNSASNTGHSNSAFGASTLAKNSTGSWNVAIGRSALASNTTGGASIAIGVGALQNNNATGNVAMGHYSLVSNTTGGGNVAIGYYSGSNNTIYGYNTYVGYYAGQSATGGSNILIGYNAGGGITTGSSNTVIGTNLSPYSNTGSNQLAIANAIWGDTGNGDTLRAKIGINVTSPTTSLEVSGTISATSARFVTATIYGLGTASTAMGNLDVRSVNGGAMITGRQLGSAYSTAAGIFTAITENPSGASNYFMKGYASNTLTYSVRADGTVSATAFVGDGSGLTGVTAAANDNITSGTAYVKVLQNVGALVSGSLAVAGPISATGDVKGNTLQLVDAPADTCSTANAGAIKRANGRFYYCRP